MTDLQQSLQLALGDAFRIDGELQGGGMSRVFLATEASLNRRVVIKVLPPELTSEVSAARFKQEMEFAARLQHPHILQVLAAGARDGLLYYIMPFASGESLRQHMDREGRLSIAETVHLVNEIADAVAFAHGHGILHRDIKPENILLEGKHAVLTDFGIGRALVESRTGDRLTATGIAVGTPGYMSPEQLAGDDIDARTDVYALAVVAYEMLAGAPPFTGPTAQAVLAAHLTQPAKPLHELSAGFPRALSEVIARALSKDVADRFASAAAFADALQAAVTGATREQSIERLPARTSSLRRLALIVGTVVVALVVGRAAIKRSESRALLATVTAAADSQDFDEVARLLGERSVALAGSEFGALVPVVAGVLAVTSSTPDAEVSITRTTPLADFPARQPISLGRTPITARPVVVGEYLVRLTADDHDTLTLIVDVPLNDSATVDAYLLQSASHAGMVLVTGNDSVAPFLISRHETTNEEFQRFVDGGGYRDVSLWPDRMVIEGRSLPRDAVLPRLVDATGLPGPRAWSGGRFPAGKANHPVSGATWYEANAYARWAGGSLPTVAQWWRAALGNGNLAVPWGADASAIESRANFSLVGTDAVGAHPLGVSPFGAHDLAGNVAEWLEDAFDPGGQHMVAGGSWNDASYMFDRSNARLLESGFSSEIIGFRIVKQAPAVPR